MGLASSARSHAATGILRGTRLPLHHAVATVILTINQGLPRSVPTPYRQPVYAQLTACHNDFPILSFHAAQGHQSVGEDSGLLCFKVEESHTPGASTRLMQRSMLACVTCRSRPTLMSDPAPP